MITKFIYHFSRFTPIVSAPSLKNSKIKHNQLIKNATDRNALLQLYQNYSQYFNMVNVVSYVRKYTDYMIQHDQVDNSTDITHTFNVLHNLKHMITNGDYKRFGDKEHDHVRSFIMLLSLSVEMLQHTQSDMTKSKFLEFAKLSKNSIYDQNLLYKCNLDEISVFMRCITQIQELNPTEEEELICWKLLKNQKFTPHQSSKVLHSLSKFQTFDEKLIEKLLQTLKNIDNEINQKDSTSLFYSFRHLYEKTSQFRDTILELYFILQDHMIKQQYKLSIKHVGMIYNAMAVIPFQPNYPFLQYMELQLMSQQLTLLCLAHFYQFHESQPEINKIVHNKIVNFLKQIKIDTEQLAEQLAMLFFTLNQHCTAELIDLFVPHLREMPINGFILGKMFSAFLKLKLNNYILYEIHQVCVARLKNFDQPMNIHSVNSIYRAQCIQGYKYQQVFIQIVDQQMDINKKQILLDNFLQHIEKKQYFELFEDLQALSDFLKIYQNQQINLTLKDLAEQLQKIEDKKIVEKAKTYIEQLMQ